MLFPYFVYSAHLAQFTRGSSLLMEKSLLMGKSKAEKSPWWKNLKKNRPKEERKSTILSKKGKKFLFENDWYWRSSTLAPRFRTKKSPSNQNLPNIMLKLRFLFLMQELALYIQKQLKIASNRNVESRLSIRCPAPQHILRSFHFCRYFFLCLKKLCSLLCHPSQCSTERSR